MSQSAGVSVRQLDKLYPGADRKALAGVSLDVKPGSFFSILGPSGCGKTTLLRILAGFEQPSAGQVGIGGVDVLGTPPRARDIAMVFQDYALYPHMTVRQNITFNLLNRRVASAEVERRLSETAGMLGIERHLAKYPAQLSGGERQRVALGRALIRKPRVFLMDEPLSNLDLKLREAMRLELGRLHQKLGITIVYVTHDQSEAMTLSTEIAILNNGVLQQVDRPDRVYGAPQNSFVATFIGSPSMNLFRAVHRDGAAHLKSAVPVALRLPFPTGLANGADVMVGARPHELTLGPPGPDRLPMRVSFVERMGRSDFVVCVPEGDEALLAAGSAVQVETESGVDYPAGTLVSVGWQVDQVKLFDIEGAAIAGSRRSESQAPRARA
jgi:ABC-type sugar transport system ATPase subunit